MTEKQIKFITRSDGEYGIDTTMLEGIDFDGRLDVLTKAAIGMFPAMIEETASPPENEQELWEETHILHTWADNYRKVWALAFHAGDISRTMRATSGGERGDWVPCDWFRHWQTLVAPARGAEPRLGHIGSQEIIWEGITIQISYTPFRNGPYGDHIEVRSIAPEKAQLPITDTGYRSIHTDRYVLEAVGGPAAYVIGFLDEEAQSPEWKRHVEAARQLDLFAA